MCLLRLHCGVVALHVGLVDVQQLQWQGLAGEYGAVVDGVT